VAKGGSARGNGFHVIVSTTDVFVLCFAIECAEKDSQSLRRNAPEMSAWGKGFRLVLSRFLRLRGEIEDGRTLREDLRNCAALDNA
jgi:hypothetical protein